MKTTVTLVVVVGGLLAWQVRADGCGTACGQACKAASTTAAQEAMVAAINPAGLDALIKAKTPVLIFDARPAKYDDGRRVPGALSLTAAATAEEVAQLAPDKSALVVTYCANTKCSASAALAKDLQSLGYTNIIEMPEGIEGWAADGRAVASAK